MWTKFWYYVGYLKGLRAFALHRGMADGEANGPPSTPSKIRV